MIEVVKAITYHPESDKFLIVKRQENDTNPLKWEFPGGTLEDETPKEAVKRELEEETKLEPNSVSKKREKILEDNNILFKFHIFLVKVESQEVKLSKEHTDYQWIKNEDADKYETIDGFEKDLEAANL